MLSGYVARQHLGVACPKNQVCELGECQKAPTTGGGGAGGGGNAGGASGSSSVDGGHGARDGGGNSTSVGGTGSGAGGGSNRGGATAQTPESKEVIGLATGGGGCRCDLPGRGASNKSALALSALLLGVLVTRRRARKEGGAL